MHFSSIFLQTPSKSLQYRLAFLRRMGGGPRTFPGGLNKWHWKRMHDKKAREKEKHLLEQEKQLYHARVRSEIRAKISASENPGFGTEKPGRNQPNCGPITPEEHIKALADRFMKEGAEDLWNENDGPLKIPTNETGKSRVIGEPIDLKKLITESSSFSGGEKLQGSDFPGNIGGCVAKPRLFSTYARYSESLMGGYGNENFGMTNSGLNLMGNRRRGFLEGVGNLFDSNCYYSVNAVHTKKNSLHIVKDGERSAVNNGLDTKSSKRKWPRFRGRAVDTDDDDSGDYYDDDGDDVETESNKKIRNSSAALGRRLRRFERRSKSGRACRKR